MTPGLFANTASRASGNALRFHCAFALLLGAGSAGCRGEVRQELPDAHQLSATPVACRINVEKVGREIPRRLFGTNLEWFNSADGISDRDGAVDPAWVSLARDEGVENIRFPGGTLSDFYHWRDGVGPQDQRPERDHPTDSGRSRNAFGTPEFLRFCQAVGAEPLITANAGTGEAAEAAAWVAYCNRRSGNAAEDGVPANAKVTLWEVGNELYLPGNPTDKKIITVSPEAYTQRFLGFAAAMRNVDPAIKLMAIATANSTEQQLPYPNWTDTLLKGAASQIDFLAIHNAYFPMIFGRTGLTMKEVYQSLWAAPEAVDRSLTALDALISKYENGRHIEVAVTEWGALFSFDREWLDQVKTMGTSVYLARLMQVCISQPRVTVADYFKFTDRSMMGWVGYDQKPKVPYFVVELFARHFGSRLVEASVQSPTYSVAQVGVAHAESDVPDVTAVASIDENGRKLFINLINRSWSTIHQVHLDLGKFDAAPTGVAWQLSSPGLTDNNGRDLPPEIPDRMFVEPTQNPSAKGTIGIERKPFEVGSPVSLEPYSIVTLEIDAKA
jgi:alpha-N-arabinofuranosidase